MAHPQPVVVVHAGAGAWAQGTDEALAACARAVESGLATLTGGGSAVDAVVAAVRVLEDAPACNAGTGAVLTNIGTLELDACVMDGATLRSGAVAVLPPFRHPVDVARAVLEDGRYHLLAGDGAAAFAEAKGFPRADPDTMITAAQRAAFERGETSGGDGGTVGAVAGDGVGAMAAATSTGGRPGTDPGRVGDTPIVGAGTYATEAGACSCTGDGEAYARAAAAFWAVDHLSMGAGDAARAAVERVLRRFHGTGGLIVVDAGGDVGVARTTAAMPHAIGRPGTPIVTGR